MKLLRHLYYAFKEYSSEQLLLKYEREIEKCREPILNGFPAHRLWNLLQLKEELIINNLYLTEQ